MSRRRVGPPWFQRMRDFPPAAVVELDVERVRRRPSSPVQQLRLELEEVG